MKLPKMTQLNNAWFGIWDLEAEQQKMRLAQKLRTTASFLMVASAELEFDKMGLPVDTELDELLELIEETAMKIETAACKIFITEIVK